MASVPAPVFVTEGVTPVAAARPFEKTTSPSAYTAKSASPMETGRLKVCMLADSFVTSVLILSESEAPAGEMVCAEIPSSKRAETRTTSSPRSAVEAPPAATTSASPEAMARFASPQFPAVLHSVSPAAPVQVREPFTMPAWTSWTEPSFTVNSNPEEIVSLALSEAATFARKASVELETMGVFRGHSETPAMTKSPA